MRMLMMHGDDNSDDADDEYAAMITATRMRMNMLMMRRMGAMRNMKMVMMSMKMVMVATWATIWWR